MEEAGSSALDLIHGAELLLTGCPVSLSELMHTHTHPSSPSVPGPVPSLALMEESQKGSGGQWLHPASACALP